MYMQTLPFGAAMGLAWTSMGGCCLYVETSVIEHGEGKGAPPLISRLLGDSMTQSVNVAYAFGREFLHEKEPNNCFFDNSKIHLHVPVGAMLMEGPSIGSAMVTAVLSLALKKPIKKDLAMTGEVTRRGIILLIGRVEEKTKAAKRSNMKTIIFPTDNKTDFEKLETNVKEGLDVHFVNNYSQIFDLAFGDDQRPE